MAGKTPDIEEGLAAALRQLFTKGGPLRIFGNSQAGALFSSSSTAHRRTLAALLERGFIEVDDRGSPTECWLTAAGREWLLESHNPWILLEDLVRAAESQREALRTMQTTIIDLGERLEQQAHAARAVLGRLTGTCSDHPAGEKLAAAAIEEHLRAYQRKGAPGDCSMAELYEELSRSTPDLTIGQFHDMIRRLHESGKILLSPWTGPLYELARPDLAILIGHEVLYYVRLHRSIAA